MLNIYLEHLCSDVHIYILDIFFYTCIHINIYINIYIYVYIHIHIFICIYKYIQMCIFIFLHTAVFFVFTTQIHTTYIHTQFHLWRRVKALVLPSFQRMLNASGDRLLSTERRVRQEERLEYVFANAPYFCGGVLQWNRTYYRFHVIARCVFFPKTKFLRILHFRSHTHTHTHTHIHTHTPLTTPTEEK